MVYSRYVKGSCQEALGIGDGDIVTVNTELRPASPDSATRKHGDVIAVLINGEPSIKEYLGCVGDNYVVGTNYTHDYLKKHNRALWMQDAFFVRPEAFLGVIEACHDAAGCLKWQREERVEEKKIIKCVDFEFVSMA